jgi:predicted transcriptional regulator
LRVEGEKQDETFEIEARQKVYQVISEAPGLHLREIQKRSNLPLGTVEYHLNYLEDNDLVIAREEGGYKRYYPKRAMSSDDRKTMSLLRQEIPRKIVIFLLNHPNSNFGEVAESLKVAPSTLAFHMKKLVKKDVVGRTKKGRTSYFSVKDPNQVARILIAHRPSFLDDLVDRFVATWTEYHP